MAGPKVRQDQHGHHWLTSHLISSLGSLRNKGGGGGDDKPELLSPRLWWTHLDYPAHKGRKNTLPFLLTAPYHKGNFLEPEDITQSNSSKRPHKRPLCTGKQSSTLDSNLWYWLSNISKRSKELLSVPLPSSGWLSHETSVLPTLHSEDGLAWSTLTAASEEKGEERKDGHSLAQWHKMQIAGAGAAAWEPGVWAGRGGARGGSGRG